MFKVVTNAKGRPISLDNLQLAHLNNGNGGSTFLSLPTSLRAKKIDYRSSFTKWIEAKREKIFFIDRKASINDKKLRPKNPILSL